MIKKPTLPVGHEAHQICRPHGKLRRDRSTQCGRYNGPDMNTGYLVIIISQT